MKKVEVSKNQENRNFAGSYRPLLLSAGLGSMLGSGVIVGLSATITVWQNGLRLTNQDVGILSGALSFAIACGSLLAGKLAGGLGLIRVFNLMNLIYALGAAICVAARNFPMLLGGLLVAGFASGVDIPVSLTVLSHDSPDKRTTASLVSGTQIFCQIGVFISYICSFFVSTMEGAAGARVVFAVLAAASAGLFVWRSFSGRLRKFHQRGEAYRAAEKEAVVEEEIPAKKFLFGQEKKKYRRFFLCILVFYVGWNLLANTFGQFQTFALIQANASQSFATGAGIILNIVGLGAAMLFASVAGGRYRNKAFAAGMTIQLGAILGMAFGSGSPWSIVLYIGCYSIGNNLGGEAMYKVWTQESFPANARAAIQGFINGFSRLCCGLFAFVTPFLVLPERISYTMLGFAGLIVISAIAGFLMIRQQKKYGVRQPE